MAAAAAAQPAVLGASPEASEALTVSSIGEEDILGGDIEVAGTARISGASAYADDEFDWDEAVAAPQVRAGI